MTYALPNGVLTRMNRANLPSPSLEFHYIMNMSRDMFLEHLKNGYLPVIHLFIEPRTSIPSVFYSKEDWLYAFGHSKRPPVGRASMNAPRQLLL